MDHGKGVLENTDEVIQYNMRHFLLLGSLIDLQGTDCHPAVEVNPFAETKEFSSLEAELLEM
ncbi:MAG: hypothetical protein ACLR8R_10400 [Oscillospiraceae bacterium]